jgi:hypothetical protein
MNAAQQFGRKKLQENNEVKKPNIMVVSDAVCVSCEA